MRNDKTSESNSVNANKSSFDPELEAKVDAMMDTERVEPPIDITNNSDTEEHLVVLPSAPEISDSLTEQMEEIKLEPLMPVTGPISTPEAYVPEPATESVSAILPEIEDPTLDAAVTDITIAEADAVLEADDAKIAAAIVVVPPKKGHRVRAFFSGWWGNPIARWATILLIIGGIIAAAAVPPSRYFILNTAGVRSTASVVVIDNSTGQPLQNVNVAIGAQSAKTNEDGIARMSEVKLGSQAMVISRVAFAPLKQSVTIGWGSNPLGEMALTATGAQYVLNASDFLSDKPVTKAKATNGDATAQADEKGKIVLTIEDPKAETVDITITSDGYRTEILTIPAATIEPQTVKMVPSQPLVYVTKQQGTYDVYKVDVDGKNKQVVLAGTGSERPLMSVLTNAAGTYTAFVSSREKRYDSEKYLLDTLSLIDLKTGAVTKIDQAQNIQLVAWRGDRLVYRAAYAAPSAATNDRQRLISYNVTESARTVLANGNYFVGIYVVDDYIYYGVNTPGIDDGGVFARVKADDSGKKTFLSRALWAVNQTKPTELYINSEDTWYSFDTTTGTLTKQQTPQDSYLSPQYFMAADSQRGAMIDQRDGQSVLVLTENGKPGKTLASGRAIYGPVTWLNDTTLSYYVDTGNETALYVVNTEGGEPVRVSSVTLVSGAGAGYY